ncbi:MAG: hypothetical protein QNK05_24710 [Myxococcota bacterium]|nr:hypothetical protein [Myxococcota bacterium]
MTLDLILDHWELALLIATWSALGVLAAKRRVDWQQRRFSQQVNFSLNTLVEENGARRLLLRTLLEQSATEVWINDYGVGRVLKAARQTTVAQPFLRIPDARDRDVVMVAVLNVLSERFSDAFVARVLGIPAKTETFLYGLTWERYGEMKTQKLRVMVIKRSDLESMFDDPDPSEIAVAEASHRPRIDTLRQMYELWTSQDPDERSAIAEVELGMPLHQQPG